MPLPEGVGLLMRTAVTPAYSIKETIAARLSSNFVAIPRIPIDKTLSLYRCHFCNIVPSEVFKESSRQQSSTRADASDVACETCAPLYWDAPEPDHDAQRYLDRIVPCPNGCSRLIRKRQCKYHLMYECQWTEVLCTGCLTVRKREVVAEACGCEPEERRVVDIPRGRVGNIGSFEDGEIPEMEHIVDRLRVKEPREISAVRIHANTRALSKRATENFREDKQKVRRRTRTVSGESPRSRSPDTNRTDPVKRKKARGIPNKPPSPGIPTRTRAKRKESAEGLAIDLNSVAAEHVAPPISKKERRKLRERGELLLPIKPVPPQALAETSQPVCRRPEGTENCTPKAIPGQKPLSRPECVQPPPKGLTATFTFILPPYHADALPLKFSFCVDPTLLKSAHFVMHGNRPKMLQCIFDEAYLQKVGKLSIFCAPFTRNIIRQSDLRWLRELIFTRPIKHLDLRGFCVECEKTNEMARKLIEDASLLHKRLEFFDAVPVDIPCFIEGLPEGGMLTFEYHHPDKGSLKSMIHDHMAKNWEISNSTEIVLNFQTSITMGSHIVQLLVTLLKPDTKTILIKYGGNALPAMQWDEERGKTLRDAIEALGKEGVITLSGFDSIEVQTMRQLVGGKGSELHYINTRNIMSKTRKRRLKNG